MDLQVFFLELQDSWAICRIFKKTNSTAQRALSHSWGSSLPETNACDMLPKCSSQTNQFTVPKTTSSSVPFQFCCSDDIQNSSGINTFSPTEFISYKPYLLPISNGDFTSNFVFSPLETSSAPSKSSVDVSSMLLNMSSSMLGDHFSIKASEGIEFSGSHQEQCSNGFSIALPHEQAVISVGSSVSENAMFNKNLNMNVADTEDHWEAGRSNNIGFPFGLPLNTVIGDAWKPNLLWDSSPCPSEMSTASFSTTKCYT